MYVSITLVWIGHEGCTRIAGNGKEHYIYRREIDFENG